MAILINGTAANSLTPASTISITGFPFTICYWLQDPLRTESWYASKVQFIWHDSANPSGYFLELHDVHGTTDGYATPRTERKASSVTYAPLSLNAYTENEPHHVARVFNSPTSTELWADGVQVATDETSRNFFAGAGAALDLLFVGGKNPTTGEVSYTGHLQDMAIWDGTALGSVEISRLQSYWSDTIPTTPSWAWRFTDDLSASVGGIDLEDTGDAPPTYTQTADIVSLTDWPTAASGNIIIG